jgi:hypothetical protein
VRERESMIIADLREELLSCERQELSILSYQRERDERDCWGGGEDNVLIFIFYGKGRGMSC